MPRQAKQLTDLAVRALEPRESEYEERFQRNLSVRVLTNGQKRFDFVYQSPLTKKRRRMRLGVYREDATVAEANRRWQEARSLLLAGKDPQQVRDEERAAQRERYEYERSRLTFAQLLDSFLREKQGILRDRTLSDYKARLNRHIVPRIGAKPIDELSEPELRRVLGDISRTVSEREAAAQSRCLKAVLSWGKRSGYIESNPMKDVSLSVRPGRRERVLSDAEIRRMWADLPTRHSSGIAPVGLNVAEALRLLLLTGQRSGELRQATWEHIDLEARCWTIPEALAKNGQRHAVYLSDTAMQILEERKRFSDGPFVFPGRGQSGEPKPMCSTAIAGAVSKWHKHPSWSFDGNWSAHDLRRTCRTIMARLGAADSIAERLINHKPPSLIAVYNRHTYWDEMVEWMTRVGDEVSRVLFFAAR